MRGSFWVVAMARPAAHRFSSPPFVKLSRLAIFCAAFALLAPFLYAADAPKTDARYPFRTDFANAELPWYQPKAGEFPPHHSDRRIGGELVSVDYYLRKGTFRVSKTGELVDFTMGPPPTSPI